MFSPKKPFLYLFLLFPFYSLFSQVENQDYEVVWHSADDNSLPQNSVKSIIKDKNGFIWMTTENGLVRYDGSRFAVFNSDNLSGIASNRMRFFRGSVSKDSLYLQNDFSEYILINNSKVAAVPVNNVPKNFKNNFISDNGKRFYINKMFKKDNSYYAFEKDWVCYYNLKNKLVWKVKYTYDLLTPFFLYKEELYVFSQNDILKFKEGKIVHEGIVNLYDKQSTIFRNPSAQQTFIVKDSSVFLLEKRDGKFGLRTLLKKYDISKSNIMSAYYDIENAVLYLGSGTDGILIAKKKTFKSSSGSDESGVYYAQVAYGSNEFLAASGEVFSTSSTFRKTLFKHKNDKYSLLIDKNEDIWTKGDNELYQFHKKTNFKTFNKWIFKDRVTQIFELNEGQIIIGTSSEEDFGGKIYLKNPSKDSNEFDFYMKVDFNTTYMLQLENNQIWTGSSKGFHKIYFKEKKVEDIKGISKTYVRSIYASNSNEIWVTTYDKGFFLYKPKSHTTTSFPLDRNKYLLSSHCIVEDNKGFFWISTNKGLFQISKKNLLDYSNKKLQQVYYQYYDRSDGFSTNEFNGGCQPCGLKLKNNYITFPSMKGNVIFNSLQVIPKLPVEDIYFEQAKVDNKRVHITNDKLYLDQDFEQLLIYIHSPYYGNANNLNIQIKFDGPISQKWTTIKDDYISYTTLPPGTYHLTARKLTGFNSEYKYKKITIVVAHKFYQTVWFYVLMFLMLVIATFYLIKLRTRYIRIKNILLEKKISEQTFQLRNTIGTLKNTKESLTSEIANHKKLIGAIAHDIKTPLRFLALTGKHLYNNKNNNDLIQDDIENIFSSSSQLYNYVDNLLEYTKVSDDENFSKPYNLHELVDQKIEIFKNIASSRKTLLINSIDGREMVTINKKLFSIVIHNILDNAVKNTYSGKIEFKVIKNVDQISIIVEDTGVGMSDELVQFYNLREFSTMNNSKIIGMGLPMISELMDIIKGEIKIESQINSGTKIILIFEN